MSCALLLAVDGDALLSAWIVITLGAVAQLDGEPVAGRVDMLDAGVFALLQASLAGAAAVEQEIAGLIPCRPHAVGTGKVLAGHQHPRAVLFLAHHALRLQLGMDAAVDLGSYEPAAFLLETRTALLE